MPWSDLFERYNEMTEAERFQLLMLGDDTRPGAMVEAMRRCSSGKITGFSTPFAAMRSHK